MFLFWAGLCVCVGGGLQERGFRYMHLWVPSGHADRCMRAAEMLCRLPAEGRAEAATANEGALLACHEGALLACHEGALLACHEGALLACHEGALLACHEGALLACHEGVLLACHEGVLLACHAR